MNYKAAKHFGLVSSSLTMVLIWFRYQAYALSTVGPFLSLLLRLSLSS